MWRCACGERSAQSFSLSHDHTHIHTHTHTHHNHTHTPQSHIQTHIHTHTHAQYTKWKNVRSCHFWLPCDTSGELWASTRQPPEVGPGNCRSTDYTFQPWCGHPAVPPVPQWSTAQPVVLSIPSLSQVPRLLFTWAWQVEKRIFFSPVVAGGTQTCDLAINSQVL